MAGLCVDGFTLTSPADRFFSTEMKLKNDPDRINRDEDVNLLKQIGLGTH